MPKKFSGGSIEEAAVEELVSAAGEFVFKASQLDGSDIVTGVDLLDLADPAARAFWFWALFGAVAIALAGWQLRKACARARVPPAATVTKKSN